MNKGNVLFLCVSCVKKAAHLSQSQIQIISCCLFIKQTLGASKNAPCGVVSVLACFMENMLNAQQVIN